VRSYGLNSNEALQNTTC